MKIVKLIKTEKENEKALREIEVLMTKPKLTKAEDDYLELLFVLVENWVNPKCWGQPQMLWNSDFFVICFS